MIEMDPQTIGMLVGGFLIAFILAFGIGANDVANSFGTSVGSRVLTLKQACILASVFETLGAVLLGAKVSDTIRKGIIDIEPYVNDTDTLMLGNVAALTGSCCWLVAATLLRMPVSATHSIVGATIGFALVAHGARGINWAKLGMIIGSWFVSPLLAGLVSTAIFFFCRIFILQKGDPLEPGLRFLPVFYAGTVCINLFSVFYEGPEMLMFDKIPLWGTFVIAFGAGTIVAVVVRMVVVPWQRRRIKEQCSYAAPTQEKSQEDQVKFTFAENSAAYSANNAVEKLGKDVGNKNPECSQNCDIHLKEYSSSETDNKQDLPPDKIPSELLKNTNTSLNSSNSSSRKNSLDLNEKQALQAAIELEEKENEKNIATLGQNKKTSNFLAPPAVVQTAIITEITKPAADGASNGTKPPPGKISKSEDAPLMDNEYKLGSSTPIKSPTAEDLVKFEKEAGMMNGFGSPNEDKKLPLDGASNALPPPTTKLTPEEETLESGRTSVADRPETARLFSFLQILTAVFGAFAHGGNDVSNAIGPLVSLWLTATTGIVMSKAATPIWILFYGGAGISIGLWLWGRRVIKTLGEDLTKITPSSGFCIEIGSALTVLVASNIGIPISTTHCKVGSVVMVGRFRAKENVDWSIFRNILLAWLVTLPVAGGISAAVMAGFRVLL